MNLLPNFACVIVLYLMPSMEECKGSIGQSCLAIGGLESIGADLPSSRALWGWGSRTVQGAL